jgi:hypothetical protein
MGLSKSGGAWVLAILVWSSTPAWGDTVRAECKLVAAGQPEPAESDSCTFSQRQGSVRVAIDGGREYAFVAQGDAPGNYLDEGGETVWRKSGLGDEGQIFQLKDERLFVYWVRSRWSCSAGEVVVAGGCELVIGAGSPSFTVRSSGTSSINTLTITPHGLATEGRPITQEIDGTVNGAEVADLNGDGWPEVYVYISSAGSGSYGSLVAYAVNGGKSISPVFLAELTDNPEAASGFMGHDEFAVVENRLVRRYPVYQASDVNSAPTGGTRQLQYQLVPGEAGWLLHLDRVVNY